jgi:hypothetical protein
MISGVIRAVRSATSGAKRDNAELGRAEKERTTGKRGLTRFLLQSRWLGFSSHLFNYDVGGLFHTATIILSTVFLIVPPEQAHGNSAMQNNPIDAKLGPTRLKWFFATEAELSSATNHEGMSIYKIAITTAPIILVTRGAVSLPIGFKANIFGAFNCANNATQDQSVDFSIPDNYAYENIGNRVYDISNIETVKPNDVYYVLLACRENRILANFLVG